MTRSHENGAPASTRQSTRSVRADWPENRTPGEYQDLLDGREFRRAFRWLQVSTLQESRNDFLERLIKSARTDIDLIDDERQRWIASQRAAGIRELSVGLDGLESFSFAVLGDPGEADESQYCVVLPLAATVKDTTFMIVMSDVIYPTGETNDYLDAFYLPYHFYDRPIYALPGNHDWYSLLTGFMWNFCDAEPLPPAAYRMTSYTWQERLARTFWLRARAPLRARLLDARRRRPPWNDSRPDWPGWPADVGGWPRQPGPYYTIDASNLRLVCIDTGISGDLDAEQGEWLIDVSANSPLPKILFTGRPLYVNNCRAPSAIHWGATTDSLATGHRRFPDVDSIVREPAHNYIAAIGGDVHNYQRYPVTLGSGQTSRILQYVVSGGGGAFLSPTHPIPRIDVPDLPPEALPSTEDTFRCYPLRGDSLARYTVEFARQIPRIFATTLGVALILAAAAFALRYAHTTEDAFWPAVGLAIVAAVVAVILVLGDWFRLRVRIAICLAGALLVVAMCLWPRWGVAIDAGVPFAAVGAVAIVGFRRWKLGSALIVVAITAVSAMIVLHGTVYGLLRAWIWTIAFIAVVAALGYLLPLTLATRVGAEIDPDACARYVADRLRIRPQRTRAQAWNLGWRTRLRLWITFPPLTIGPVYVPLLYSALFDFGTPPFFKSFLRFDVDERGVTVLVYAVTGFRVHEHAPRVEDSYRWRRSDGRWTTARAVLQDEDDPHPRASMDFFADENGGHLVVDLGSDFSAGTYRLAARQTAGDEELVDLGTAEAAASPFEVAVRDVPLPARGWFQEVEIARDGALAGSFRFR
jgi:hypothetical protein